MFRLFSSRETGFFFCLSSFTERATVRPTRRNVEQPEEPIVRGTHTVLLPQRAEAIIVLAAKQKSFGYYFFSFSLDEWFEVAAAKRETVFQRSGKPRRLDRE